MRPTIRGESESRKNEPQNRKTAIGAFFCTGKIRMETGLIIENGLILPSKMDFKIDIFRYKLGKKPVFFKF